MVVAFRARGHLHRLLGIAVGFGVALSTACGSASTLRAASSPSTLQVTTTAQSSSTTAAPTAAQPTPTSAQSSTTTTRSTPTTALSSTTTDPLLEPTTTARPAFTTVPTSTTTTAPLAPGQARIHVVQDDPPMISIEGAVSYIVLKTGAGKVIAD